MNHASLLITLSLFFNVLVCQNKELFHFNLNEKHTRQSLYNSIDLIDSRNDTLDFGKVYSAKYKRMLSVVPSTDLYTQFNWVLHNFIDSISGNKELLIQLRKFKFYEIIQDDVNRGFCTIRIDLYSKENNNYYKLARLDSTIYVEDFEITPALFNASSKAITDFIFGFLTKEDLSGSSITRRSVIKIDSVEKSETPLYNKENFTNGGYLSYTSFKNQKPELEIVVVKYKQGNIKTVVIKENGSNKKLSIKKFYSIVYEGKPYVVGDFGTYLIKRKESDLCFVARARVTPDATSAAYATNFGYFLGGNAGYFVGKNLSEKSAIGLYETKLDHLDGSFIWQKRLE